MNNYITALKRVIRVSTQKVFKCCVLRSLVKLKLLKGVLGSQCIIQLIKLYSMTAMVSMTSP